MIYSNVWGSSLVISLSSYKWFVTFNDYYSMTAWMYLMHAKSELFPYFQSYKMISTQFGVKVKILRIDR